MVSYGRDHALAEIGTIVAYWLRYERESRERDGDPAPNVDTHIIPPCWPTYGQLCNWLDYLNPAKAIEARRAIDAEGGVVGDESAVPKGFAQGAAANARDGTE